MTTIDRAFLNGTPEKHKAAVRKILQDHLDYLECLDWGGDWKGARRALDVLDRQPVKCERVTA